MSSPRWHVVAPGHAPCVIERPYDYIAAHNYCAELDQRAGAVIRSRVVFVRLEGADTVTAHQVRGVMEPHYYADPTTVTPDDECLALLFPERTTPP